MTARLSFNVRRKTLHVNYRFGIESDLDLLAEWNHQIIRDEGHRNTMSVRQLRERMKGWPEGKYKAVLFDIGSDPVAYTLHREGDQEIYLRQLFVRRGHRRQGIEGQAVGILRKQIWPPDKRLTVDVLKANEPAVAFWRSVGYTDYCFTLKIMPKGCGEQAHAPNAFSAGDA